MGQSDADTNMENTGGESAVVAEAENVMEANNPDVDSGTEESKQGGGAVAPRPGGRFETTQTFKDDEDMESYNDFLGQFAADSSPPTPEGQVCLPLSHNDVTSPLSTHLRNALVNILSTHTQHTRSMYPINTL